MREVAVYSVVYPAALRFFAEFWGSLRSELDDGYAPYLSLHGVTEQQLEEAVGDKVSARFLHAPERLTPAEVRSQGLAAICDDHDAVVLLDSDDIVLPGRLGAASEALDEVDVYACAMQIVDIDGRGAPDLTFTLNAQEEAALAEGELLPRVNAFGFSNSAYRCEVLARCLPVPAETVLMDWLVASRADLADANLGFDARPFMGYRQYGDNTARVVPPFSAERVMRDAVRVTDHHRLLASGASRYRESAARAERFAAWLQGDEANADKYAGRLEEIPRDVYLWWQHVDAVHTGGSGTGEWVPS